MIFSQSLNISNKFLFVSSKKGATFGLISFLAIFLGIISGFLSVEAILANPLGIFNTIENSLLRPLVSDFLSTVGIIIFAFFIALIVSVSIYIKYRNR